jgi:GNAT superfamily N-acetyltransferase
MASTITTWYLELADPAALVAAKPPPAATVLVQAEVPSPELGRYFYTAVGGPYRWRDRLPWTTDRWLEHLAQPGREIWYATQRGTPVGYFELDATRLPDVEVAAFGLLPAFVGRGFGGWLLEQALRRGLALGPRVWLHTCTLDHPNALGNYQARGLTVYQVEHRQEADAADGSGPRLEALRPIGGPA